MTAKLADKTDFLRQLDRFQILLKKNVHSQYQGSRESPNTGSGLTFKDYKAYVPGDDFRNIDWKVYGRTDKFYVRRYEEERDLTVHIIVDSSASMDYGEPTKYEYASLLGTGFAYLALKNNEKFDFSTFAEELQPVRARKGRRQLLGLIDYLESVRVNGKTAFSDSLESTKSLIKSKSLIVIVSDFLYPVEEIERTLARFKNSQVLCIQVLDPIERSFAIEGDYILEDAEEGFSLRTFITRRVKNNYRQELETHIAQIRNVCEHLRHDFVTVTTDQEIFDSFFEAYTALQT